MIAFWEMKIAHKLGGFAARPTRHAGGEAGRRGGREDRGTHVEFLVGGLDTADEALKHVSARIDDSETPILWLMARKRTHF